MENLETAASELGGLRLPPELEPLEVAGKGSRSIIFRASYRGDIVAMKVYRPEIIERYRKKHDVNIAVFEMSRNRQFRKVPDLLPYTAKPLSVMGHDGHCTLMFLQEFIDGVPLTKLAEINKGLPDSVLEAGETIVRDAELNELYDLDFACKDVLVRKQSGVWVPVLHDFNQVPKAKPQSNSLMALVRKAGRGKKARGDYRHLEEWRNFSNKCAA